MHPLIKSSCIQIHTDSETIALFATTERSARRRMSKHCRRAATAHHQRLDQGLLNARTDCSWRCGETRLRVIDQASSGLSRPALTFDTNNQLITARSKEVDMDNIPLRIRDHPYVSHSLPMGNGRSEYVLVRLSRRPKSAVRQCSHRENRLDSKGKFPHRPNGVGTPLRARSEKAQVKMQTIPSLVPFSQSSQTVQKPF